MTPKHTLKYGFCLLTLLLPLLSHAAPQTRNSQPLLQLAMGKAPKNEVPVFTKPDTVEAPKMKRKKNFVYCPDVSKLYLDGLTWRGPGGWQSHSDSFTKAIDQFNGAQWIGVNIGKVICRYQGANTEAFIVSLERDNLVISPEEGAWGKDQGGYKNCKSHHIKDCPFEGKLEKAIKMEDVYQDIGGFKTGG